MAEFRWKKVDEFELDRRAYLKTSDECYYLMDRDNRGFSMSEANQKVANFKISPKDLQTNPSRKQFKDDAIMFFIDNVDRLIVGDGLNIAIIPAVTSKPRANENFNNALDIVAFNVGDRRENRTYLPIFDCINQIAASHEGGPRRPQELSRNIIMKDVDFNYDLAVILDDVLTTGGHYRAMADMLLQKYPNVRVAGVFLSLHIFI